MCFGDPVAPGWPGLRAPRSALTRQLKYGVLPFPRRGACCCAQLGQKEFRDRVSSPSPAPRRSLVNIGQTGSTSCRPPLPVVSKHGAEIHSSNVGEPTHVAEPLRPAQGQGVGGSRTWGAGGGEEGDITRVTPAPLGWVALGRDLEGYSLRREWLCLGTGGQWWGSRVSVRAQVLALEWWLGQRALSAEEQLGGSLPRHPRAWGCAPTGTSFLPSSSFLPCGLNPQGPK